MAFNNFRVNFEFQGKLEVLEAKEGFLLPSKAITRNEGSATEVAGKTATEPY